MYGKFWEETGLKCFAEMGFIKKQRTFCVVKRLRRRRLIVMLIVRVLRTKAWKV